MRLLTRALALTAVAMLAVLPAFATPTGIVWLIFVDDLHLDFRTTGQLRSALKGVSGTLVREGDGYLIRTSGPSNVAVDLTEDRTRLDQAIKNVSGNGLKPTDIIADADGKAVTSELRYRGEVALKAVRALIAGVEDLQYHRKALIYVSNGYPDGSVTPDELSEVADAAARAGITIVALDPRTLPGAPGPSPAPDPVAWRPFVTTTRDTLRKLAEPTGGFVHVGEQSLQETLERIDRSVR